MRGGAVTQRHELLLHDQDVDLGAVVEGRDAVCLVGNEKIPPSG